MSPLHIALLSCVVLSVGCSSASPAQDTPPSTMEGPVADAGSSTNPAPPAEVVDGAAKPTATSCERPPIVRETFESVAESGTTTHYRLAPQPRGIIVALHGAGGSSTSLVSENTEWGSFFHEAATRNYVILVPESLQREAPRQWEAQSATGDTPHIASLLDSLSKKANLPAALPVFVVGMSNGGGAAPIVGALLAKEGRPVRAVGIYCAGASSIFDMPEYTLPTIFSLMANDSVMTKNEDVVAKSHALTARGIATDVAIKEASTLCPEAFTRIPGIDASASRDITAQLRAKGVLTEEGQVHFAIDQDVATLVPSYATFARPIEEQLRVAAADHTFYGARNDATLSFFDAQAR